MDTVLMILGWAVFGLAIVAGLGLDLVGLFGNWVILGAVGILWAVTGFEHFGPWGLGFMIGLAVLGEVVEALAAGYGTARFGGSRGAVVCALIGCIAGAILGSPWIPVLGTIAGACLGAFVGATAHEFVLMRQRADKAIWAGVGAALGKVAGMFAKMLAGLIMLGVAAATY